MRAVIVALVAACMATPAVSQEAAHTSSAQVAAASLTRGARSVGFAAGYSWFSPRGSHWGLISHRRIYLASVTTQVVRAVVGRVALATTAEFPMAVVQRTRSDTEDCWWHEQQQYCIDDVSGRVAVGVGAIPGVKLHLNPSGATRVVGGAAAGMMFFSNEVPVRNAGRFAFALQYGVGVELASSPERTWTLGYKFFHLSNGGTWYSNPGLDGNVLYVGTLKRR